MANLCSNIVDAFGSSWLFIGWGVFLLWFFLPFFPFSEGVFWLSWVLLSGLLAFWWIVDAVDQAVAWWQMALVVLMIGLSCSPAPYVGILRIAAWVVYQFRFRDL